MDISGSETPAQRTARPAIALRLDRYAFFIWLAAISQPWLNLVFVLQGSFRYASAAYANRMWSVLVLLIFLPDAISTFLRPRAYLAIIAFLSIWGLLLENGLSNVASDAGLLWIGLIFYTVGRHIAGKGEQAVVRFLRHFFFLSLLYLLVVAVPAHFLGFAWVSMDMTFVLSVLVVGFFTGRWQAYFEGAAGLAVLNLLARSKTFLLQFILGLGISGRRMIIMLGVLLAVGAAALLFAMQSQLNIIAITKLERLLQSLDQWTTAPAGQTVASIWRDPFALLDTSTGERVFELHQAFNAIQESLPTRVFGRGMGGAVDLTQTQDNSVVLAHGGVQNLKQVRVIHLGFAFTLLKGGYFGLVVYVLFLITAVVLGWRLTRSRNDWYVIAGVALILYLIPTLFTFANGMKEPGLWIMLAVATTRPRQPTAAPQQNQGLESKAL